MKYIVNCGSLVTVLRQRKFEVSANSQEEAEEKAKDRFYKIGVASDWDIGGDIIIDDVEEVD